MKRIFLFVVTNLAILVVLSITARILGIDRILTENGCLDEFRLIGEPFGDPAHDGNLGHAIAVAKIRQEFLRGRGQLDSHDDATCHNRILGKGECR